MSSSRPLRLGLVLAGLCVLGMAASRPASAQAFQYTLNSVNFADGATASGTFSYNFTTGTFSAFDVTTTNGLTGNLLGTHYVAATATASATSNFLFTFTHGSDFLNLNTTGPDNAAGTILLTPGTSSGSHQLTASGEFALPTGLSRVISSGSLIATAAPVPEASTTASLGLLLALGLGGLVIAKRRRKAARPTA